MNVRRVGGINPAHLIDAMRALVNENAKIKTPQTTCHSEEEESQIAWRQPASYNGMNKQIRAEIRKGTAQA